MTRSSRLRAPLLLSLGAVLVTTAALVPAQAAPTPPKVTGNAVSAWEALPYVDPGAAPLPKGQTFYFTGTPTDEVGKQLDAPTATFTATKPTGGTAIVQTTQPLFAGGESARNSGSAYWEGDVRGRLAGRMAVTTYWSTLNATTSLVNDNVGIRVFADPGTDQEKLIGSGTITVRTVGAAPSPVEGFVDVDGVVAERLSIQVAPLFADASQELRVYYGSADAPASFSLPKAAAKPPQLPSTRAVKDTSPLSLAATYIGRKAAEPTLGVTKEGNVFITAGDFDGLSPATPQTLIYASYDGSRTYKDVTNYVAGMPVPPTTLDPYLFVDEDTSRVYSIDLYVGCSYLQWTDDQGESWELGNPLACGVPVDDHQTFVVGNPSPGVTPIGYPNVLYYCTNKIAGATCARSLDGGRTFGASGQPSFLGVGTGGGEGAISPGVCGGLHGHIVVDNDGRLYVPKGHCGNPWLAVSEDGGLTWRQTQVSSMAAAGTHTAVTTDAAGNVYYAWWQAGTQLPYMAVSRDSGRTFGPPLLVGPPGLKGANFPSLDADLPGRVAITYPGTMVADATSPTRPWNYYVNVTSNALAPRPVFHTATANPLSDPVHRGPCSGRCGGMFDFLDVVFAPDGSLYAAAVDTCTQGCVDVPAKATALEPAQRASDAQGVVVRQLGGGKLRRR